MSFCKTHSRPQLEETFLGRWIFFSCGLEWKTFSSIWLWSFFSSSHLDSFHSPGQCASYFSHFSTMNAKVPEDLSCNFFSLPMNICTCILSNDIVFPQPEYKHIPKNITKNTGKSFSEQSCNLCKWNLRSHFPFPYWLVFFSWSLLALGLTFWCQHSGLWNSWMVSELQSGQKQTQMSTHAY